MLAACLCLVESAQGEELRLPLHQGSGGGFELELEVAGQTETFLVDTGAAMVTINGALAKRLRHDHLLDPVRTVAGRMADGRVRKLEVFRTQALAIDPSCTPQAVEVLVVPGKGRNLLGMNMLSSFAPLTLAVSPPTLGLAGCTAEEEEQTADAGSEATTPRDIAALSVDR